MNNLVLLPIFPVFWVFTLLRLWMIYREDVHKGQGTVLLVSCDSFLVGEYFIQLFLVNDVLRHINVTQPFLSIRKRFKTMNNKKFARKN